MNEPRRSPGQDTWLSSGTPQLHYNTAWPHRALGQLAPAQAHTRPPQINLAEHQIRRKQVLGGLTHEYQIAA